MTHKDELTTLWTENRAYLRRLLISYTRDIDLAEDLLQDTFVRAQRGFDGYRGGDAKAWLSTIARNAFYSHVRTMSYASEHTQLDVDPIDDAMHPGSGTHIDAMSTRQAVSQLDPSLRQALLLKHYAGLTYDEIALLSGCPTGTAKTRVSTALKNLRRIMGLASDTEAAECRQDREIADYLYGALSSSERQAFQQHLEMCARCRTNVEELGSTVRALDMIEGNQKMMHILEIDQSGEAKLHVSRSTLNEWDQPLLNVSFYTGRKARLLHWIADGQELTYRQWSDPSQPKYVNYEAELPHSIPPGQRVEEMTIFRMHPEEANPQALGDGIFRLVWTQRPELPCDVAYVQAIRIPSAARLTHADPKPREIRVRGEHTTLLWVSLLSPGECFRCCVEYRPADS